MNEKEKLAEVLAEIFLSSLKLYTTQVETIRAKSYEEVEDYLVKLFTDLMVKVYKVQEFDPELFRKSLRKRKDRIAQYIVFSS